MYQLLRDVRELSFVKVDSHLPLFCDIETMVDEGRSSGGLYGKVRLIQTFQEGWEKAIIFDCEYIPLQSVLDHIQPYTQVYHGGAFDLHTINLKTEKTWIPADIEDTLYLSRLKYFTKTKFKFYECLEYAGLVDELIDSIDKKEEQKSDWSGPLSEKQLTYAAADVIYLSKLYEEIKEFEKSTVYKLDIDNLKLAIDYSRNGMPTNSKTIKKLKKSYMTELEKVLEELPINPRSTKQAPIYMGTKNSDSYTLAAEIRKGNNKAQRIKDARHCYKMVEYLDSYNKPVIKGFFQPNAALAGRFACTGGNSFFHVNLQQLPHELSSVFEAPPGHKFGYKDFSGLELRLAAAYTGDPVMSSLLKEGADLHDETTRIFFGEGEIVKEERQVSKASNFTLIFGGGVKAVSAKLVENFGINWPSAELKIFKDQWFDTYEAFKEWHNIHKNRMNIYGYVDITTALGRTVRTYKLTDSLNFPIQGSSVEVTKVSLVLLRNKLKELAEYYDRAYIVNVVHDSITILATDDTVEMYTEVLDECMVEAWEYVIEDLLEPDIPMPKGTKIGQTWEF